MGVEELERPLDWRVKYIGQEAEASANLLLTARRAKEALDAGAYHFTGKFLEILLDGLSRLHESLEEAYDIETGRKSAERRRMQRRLDDLTRQYEATSRRRE